LLIRSDAAVVADHPVGHAGQLQQRWSEKDQPDHHVEGDDALDAKDDCHHLEQKQREEKTR
jgi:hypothetical protein